MSTFSAISEPKSKISWDFRYLISSYINLSPIEIPRKITSPKSPETPNIFPKTTGHPWVPTSGLPRHFYASHVDRLPWPHPELRAQNSMAFLGKGHQNHWFFVKTMASKKLPL